MPVQCRRSGRRARPRGAPLSGRCPAASRRTTARPPAPRRRRPPRAQVPDRAPGGRHGGGAGGSRSGGDGRQHHSSVWRHQPEVAGNGPTQHVSPQPSGPRQLDGDCRPRAPRQPAAEPVRVGDLRGRRGEPSARRFVVSLRHLIPASAADGTSEDPDGGIRRLRQRSGEAGALASRAPRTRRAGRLCGGEVVADRTAASSPAPPCAMAGVGRTRGKARPCRAPGAA